LVSLIDEEQLAHKLETRVGEVVTHAQQSGFPSPVAYHRGRILGTRRPSTAGSEHAPTPGEKVHRLDTPSAAGGAGYTLPL